MSGTTVLVVDDERNIVELLKLYLSREGYQVETAFDGQGALEKARALRPALILLDLMLPDIDGFDVCRQLRKTSDVPIIMLTARGEDVDKVVGLELGADDYVTKPFNPREVVARVKAVLRRYSIGSLAGDVLRVGDLTVDVTRREVDVAGRKIELRTKEFDLLAVFARHPGVVFSRERLLNLVWGYDYYGDTRTIDVHITWLRDKLGDSKAQIQTVWGVGYKLMVEQA